MTKLSEEKIKRIKEDILSLLYRAAPKSLFIAEISRELARDEEFVKRLLSELEAKEFVVAVKKSPKGMDYRRRTRWRLTSKVYKTYRVLEQNK